MCYNSTNRAVVIFGNIDDKSETLFGHICNYAYKVHFPFVKLTEQ